MLCSRNVPALLVCVLIFTGGCSGKLSGSSATSAGGSTGHTPVPGGGGGGPNSTTDPGGSSVSQPGPFVPAAPGLRRLTVPQYQSSVAALLGAPFDASLTVPRDAASRHQLTHVSASSATFSSAGIEQLEHAALASVEAVFTNATQRQALVGCTPASASDSCVATFLQRIGRRAYRRPLSADELTALKGVVVSVGDVWTGLQYAVAGLLESPSFLYVVEQGQADAQAPGGMRLTPYELATRLSLYLWDTVPDDALLDAAVKGALDTPEGLRQTAASMVADPRARPAVQRLFNDLFELDSLDSLAKSTSVYPSATPTLLQAMKTEVHKTVEDLVFDQRGDFRELFTQSRTFVNGELSALYGLPAPKSPGTFEAVTFSAQSPRVGLLGMGAILAVNARVDRTSPTLRGLFLRESLLCAPVAPPPPNVNEVLPADPPSNPRTAREKLEVHRTNPECSGCHGLTDPPGLALEHFDGIGAYRADDHGLAIDTTGELLNKPFDGLRSLAQLLHDEPRIPTCLVRQVYRQATGHLELSSEEAAIRALAESFTTHGYRLTELMADVAASDGFRFVTAAP